MYLNEILDLPTILLATIGGAIGGVIFVFVSNNYSLGNNRPLTKEELETIRGLFTERETRITKKLHELLKDVKKCL